MPHRELNLLAKIIDDCAAGKPGLREAMDCGIKEYAFIDELNRDIFKYLLDYYQDPETAGNVPDRDMVMRTFKKRLEELPGVQAMDVKALCVEVLKHTLQESLQNLGEELLAGQTDPDAALDLMRQKSIELTAIRKAGVDLDFASSGNALIEEYEFNKNQKGMLGVPYPWKYLNHETKGMQDGEFIVLYGRPKSQKTWLLLYIAAYAYDYANRNVLVYTREMTPKQMRNRLICILLGAPYGHFKDARLDELKIEGTDRTYENKFYELAESLDTDEEVVFEETKKRKKIIITNDRGVGMTGSISGLEAKVATYAPDLICVDGAYLLQKDGRSSGSRHDEMTYITHALKNIAQKYNRPLICTTQANRIGESDGKMGSVMDIAHSDSFGQDADLALKIIKQTIDKDHDELAILFAAARECKAEGFAIHGDPASNFNQIMQKGRYPDGSLKVDENELPIFEPIIFYSRKEVRDWFKEEESRFKADASTVANFMKKGRQ